MNKERDYQSHAPNKKMTLRHTFFPFILGIIITIAVIAILPRFGICPYPHGAYQTLSSACGSPPVACDDEKRYLEYQGNSGVNLDHVSSKEMIRNFYQHVYRTPVNIEDGGYDGLPFHPASGKAGGAFISKKLLDHIFTVNDAANGIMCYYGWAGNENGELQLIVTPGVSQDINITGMAPDNNIYLIRSYCPPSCDFVHDPR